ncbi:MAG: hypothetical protein GC160_19505 [Acidobacteria bacterium]|nr:hypothetical protein [Acidobacteriota bacterium]
MPQFPKLKTGASAQYPATRELRLASEAQRFLDSTEQRYIDSAAPRRRWVLDLSLLDGSEAAVLREFFLEMRGTSGEFDFEDPWTGEVVTGCRFGSDAFTLAAEAEWDLRTSVTIWEP